MSDNIDRTSRSSSTRENLEQPKIGLHHPVWMLRKHQKDMHIGG